MEVAMSTSSTPCLDQIEEGLTALGVTANPNKVASAILFIAEQRDWEGHPQQVIEWVEALAVELARSWPKAAG
jgi:hypothetical protein